MAKIAYTVQEISKQTNWKQHENAVENQRKNKEKKYENFKILSNRL